MLVADQRGAVAVGITPSGRRSPGRRLPAAADIGVVIPVRARAGNVVRTRDRRRDVDLRCCCARRGLSYGPLRAVPNDARDEKARTRVVLVLAGDQEIKYLPLVAQTCLSFEVVERVSRRRPDLDVDEHFLRRPPAP